MQSLSSQVAVKTMVERHKECGGDLTRKVVVSETQLQENNNR